MAKLPKLIYVTADANDDGGENLLAWKSLTASDDGRVGVYELRETIDKREVAEVRRKGTKTWFKP